MALTIQIVADSHPQSDGRRWVEEIYSDAQGEVSRIIYKGRDTDDRNAIASARSQQILSGLAIQELKDAIQNDVKPSMRFATAQQFADYIAEMYPTLTGEQQAHLSWWINNRLEAGDVTDAQMQNLFGLTAGQWATRKAKIQTLAAQYEAVITAVA